jgi:hypothetical protein
LNVAGEDPTWLGNGDVSWLREGAETWLGERRRDRAANGGSGRFACSSFCFNVGRA